MKKVVDKPIKIDLHIHSIFSNHKDGKKVDFNTEENYVLEPDVDDYIQIASNMTKIEINQEYLNRYVVRGSKIYDKVNHTFKISQPLRATVTFALTFDEVPEVVRRYVTMSAAYKFVKRELGAQAVCAYTQEDLAEAKADMYNHEIDIGNYSMIPEMYTGEIRGEL